MRVGAKRRVDRAVPVAQNSRAVDVDWRALGSGQRREGNTVAHEFLGGAGEADHEDL
jgi:hypothetical protein